MSKVIKILLVFLVSFVAISCKQGTNKSNRKPGVVVASIQNWTGVKQLGSTSSDPAVKSIITDSGGNTYIAGTQDISGINGLPLIGEKDIFLTKYNSSGSKEWVRTYGASGSHSELTQNSLVVGEGGSVYLVFSCDGSPITGLANFPSKYGTYIFKINTNGNTDFSRVLRNGSGSENLVRAVSLASDGGMVVFGVSVGSFDYRTPVGTQDSFISKVNKDGVTTWSAQYGVSGRYTESYGLFLDSSDNIFIIGSQERADSGEDVFVKRLNSSGVVVWARTYGEMGAFNNVLTSIHGDNNGNIYFTGTGSNNFNGSTLTGARDGFLVKLTTAGDPLWFRSLGNNPGTTVSLNTVTGDGDNVYISGSTDGPFSGLSLTGTGDAFIIKYNSSGSKQWTRQVGEVGAFVTQGALGIKYDSTLSGYSLYVSGETTASLNNGVQNGVRDVYVAKFNTNGTKF